MIRGPFLRPLGAPAPDGYRLKTEDCAWSLEDENLVAEPLGALIGGPGDDASAGSVATAGHGGKRTE